MKTQVSSIACLVVLVAAAVAVSGAPASDERSKRSILVHAAPVVATVPVVQQTHVVHNHPTSVVRTEQVRSGDHASYSYTSEVKSNPVVHTHTHAAVAAVPTHAVATHAVVPSAYYATNHYATGYYPSAYSYYSPYSYVIGKKSDDDDDSDDENDDDSDDKNDDDHDDECDDDDDDTVRD